MKPDSEFDPLVDALRADLPNPEQSARLRARLSALGIAATATSLATSTAAASGLAAKGAANLGFAAAALSRVGTWSFGVKVGLAGAVVGTAVASTALVSTDVGKRAPAAQAARGPANVNAPRKVLGERAIAAPPEVPPLPAPTPIAASPVVEPPTRGEPPNAVAARAVRPRVPVRVTERAVAPAHAIERAVTPVTVSGDAVAALPPADPAAESALGSSATTTLSEETALLDGAFAALRAGDHELASRFVLAHERRFPNGLLSRERERARAVLSSATRP